MQARETKATMPDGFALLLGAATLATVLDVESTKYAQNDPEAAEFNSWIYGERPSRIRMYAVSIPVTAALAGWAAYLKSTLAEDEEKRWAWQLPLWGLTIGHSLAAAANFFNFRNK